jgi:hypothetical protein
MLKYDIRTNGVIDSYRCLLNMIVSRSFQGSGLLLYATSCYILFRFFAPKILSQGLTLGSFQLNFTFRSNFMLSLTHTQRPAINILEKDHIQATTTWFYGLVKNLTRNLPFVFEYDSR